MAFYNCLLFDMDDTLLDFAAAEDAAIHETLEHFEFDDIDSACEKYKAINKLLWQKLDKGEIKQDKLVVLRFEQLLREVGKLGNAAEMNKFYLGALSTHCDIYVGVDEMLDELSQVATLAIVSNGIEYVQARRLKDSGIEKYFDAVAVSGKIGASKPARRIFDAVLTELGIENRSKVLVVGNSLSTDVQGGKNAGLKTCLLNTNGEDLPENSVKPDYVIKGYEQLLRIVMEEDELTNVGSQEKRHQVQVV
ncbi:MAG: noncanonical pyrimidine nucleotidase, YjjG family [Clostridia bacterium]|nr:noncanonical pyrimidine nucleotidase, YjjG family [Clostridia bacterium]NLS86263.1 noncanonical pyrimidine nucleotidase, YjjG family [Oscillospiraceae bacterium]